MSDEIYLNLNIKNFEETKEDAKRRDIEDCGDDANGYKYPNISLNIDGIEFKEGFAREHKIAR